MKRRERGWEFKERPLRPIHKKYCLDLSQLLEMKEKYRQYRDSILELIEDREKEEALLAEFERRRQLAVPKEVVSREMKPSSSFGEAMRTNKEIELELTTNKKKIVFPKKFSSTTVATIDESIVQQEIEKLENNQDVTILEQWTEYGGFMVLFLDADNTLKFRKMTEYSGYFRTAILQQNVTDKEQALAIFKRRRSISTFVRDAFNHYESLKILHERKNVDIKNASSKEINHFKTQMENILGEEGKSNCGPQKRKRRNRKSRKCQQKHSDSYYSRIFKFEKT